MGVALGPHGPDAEAGACWYPWGTTGGGGKAALGGYELSCGRGSLAVTLVRRGFSQGL